MNKKHSKSMKRFVSFVRKEFYHIFRDKRTLLILFGIPIAQVLLFGYVITNEIKNIPIAILDNSSDYVTQRLTNKLLSSGFFELHARISNPDDIEKIFSQGIVKEVIVFESDFAHRLEHEKKADIQLIADASDANMANLTVTYTSAILLDYMREINAGLQTPLQITPQTRMLYNEELKGVHLFIPGIMAMILMLVSAMMTSISIAREKEMGTMEILLVSPLHPIQIIIGKVTPYFTLSFINAVSILLLGRYVFDVPIQGNTVLLLAECMLFIMLALSLGIFISTAAPNQQIAMLLSMFALMLPTILLSGFIFPIENMPLPLQIISHAMPPRWFIIIVKDLMIKGTTFAFVWKETLILVGMTLFFIAMSVRKFKIRLE